MKIWYRYKDGPAEVVDTCRKRDVGYLLREYALAYGLLPRQINYGKAKLWAGLKRDEPKGE